MTKKEAIKCIRLALKELERDALIFKVDTRTPLEIAIYIMRRKARELAKEEALAK